MPREMLRCLAKLLHAGDGPYALVLSADECRELNPVQVPSLKSLGAIAPVLQPKTEQNKRGKRWYCCCYEGFWRVLHGCHGTLQSKQSMNQGSSTYWSRSWTTSEQLLDGGGSGKDAGGLPGGSQGA